MNIELIKKVAVIHSPENYSKLGIKYNQDKYTLEAAPKCGCALITCEANNIPVYFDDFVDAIEVDINYIFGTSEEVKKIAKDYGLPDACDDENDVVIRCKALIKYLEDHDGKNNND